MKMKTLRKRLVLFFAMILLTMFFGSLIAQAQAANWYVRPSGGSGSGTSWTAAWNGFNGINWASVSAGDTIWVAGGTFTSALSPGKSGTSGARIAVRRARSDSTECTGAAGWSASYGSTINQNGITGISATTTTSYITISGRTTATGGSNGWVITNTSLGGVGIDLMGGTTNYLLIEYIDVVGGVHTTTSISNSDSRGINDRGGDSTDHTYSHVNVRGFCSTIYVCGVTNFVFEYGSMYDISPTDIGPSCHPNTIYIGWRMNHGIVRYNKFYSNDGEGVVWSDGTGNGPWDDWKLYGNLFYDLNLGYSKAMGIQEATVTNLKIWNNTFYNNYATLYNSDGGTCGTGSENRNNIGGGNITCGTASNNLDPSDAMFLNLAARDFHIVSTTGTGYPRNAGTTLSSDGYINYDRDLVLRGGDGTWDIGAFEFKSTGTGNIKPFPPTMIEVK